MDSDAIETYTRFNNAITADGLKKSLDGLFTLIRKNFVFDNLVIYLAEGDGKAPEAVYARAAGRGRNKEADASWGEEIANQVIAFGRIVELVPTDPGAGERTAKPYLLGLPLVLQDRSGALVFVRFGGPEFREEQLPVASLAAVQAARALDLDIYKSSLSQLDLARHRAQLQDDFIATISHELHSPLGFIKGYTTSLLRSDTVWDESTRREFLTIIDEESDHLLALIDRMLESARLQSGTMSMNFQPVRLDSLIRDVTMRFQARHTELDVALKLESGPSIPADNVHLTQVFDNLFDNAIKYAQGAGISIVVQATDDWQTILFSDSGPGIPPEHVSFLFERFYQVPGQYGKSGAGLGLFICKQIIQAHHGKISVQTTPGKGTAFRIELPSRLEQGE